MVVLAAMLLPHLFPTAAHAQDAGPIEQITIPGVNGLFFHYNTPLNEFYLVGRSHYYGYVEGKSTSAPAVLSYDIPIFEYHSDADAVPPAVSALKAQFVEIRVADGNASQEMGCGIRVLNITNGTVAYTFQTTTGIQSTTLQLTSIPATAHHAFAWCNLFDDHRIDFLTTGYDL